MIKLLNEWKFIYWTKVGFKNNGPNGLNYFFNRKIQLTEFRLKE